MNNWHRSEMIFFDEILADKTLSSSAKLVAGKILSMTNCGKNECFLPNSFICRTLNITKPTAIKAIKELENKNLITTTFKHAAGCLMRCVSWNMG